MNKKQMARVVNLYRDGVSLEVCISSIIEMSKTNLDAGISITKFIESMKIIDEYKTKGVKSYVQSLDRTKPSIVEDK